MTTLHILLASPDPLLSSRVRAVLVECRFDTVDGVRDRDTLCERLRIAPPDVLVLDARWMGDLSAGLPQPQPSQRFPRIVACADRLCAPGMLEAVETGARGCICSDATPTQWRQALEAVHNGEVWVPRWLLAKALRNLQRRVPPGEADAAGHLGALTDRQREIVRGVAEGLSNKEIGRRLGISPTTVKTHMHNIFERVGFSGRNRLLASTVGRRRMAGG